ncbi:MAG: ABC transporter permease subunit [Bacillota bacterium]|nr:ABC transporter permease subunit [Bacillota bacterium]
MKINPVLRKELKLTVRTVKTSILLMVYAGILAFVAVAMFATITNSIRYGASYSGYIALYGIIAGMQFGLILFIVPAISSSSISGERERQTLEILLSTKLSPFSIISGKLMSSISKVILLVVSSIPIFAIVFLFGGVQAVHIVQLVLLYVVTVIYIGSIGICLSTFFKSTKASTAAAYGVVFALVLGTVFVTFIYFAFLESRAVGHGTAFKPFIPFFLYINPGLGFASLITNQIGGGNLFSLTGANNNSMEYAWIINLIVELVMSVLLIFVAAKKLNPIKKSKKVK